MAKKIFELAKELDQKPLDLVEKLKSMGFSVRNHMASLSDADLAKFYAQSLAEKTAEEAKLSKKKAKKKVVKKKVAKKVETKISKTSKKKVVAKTVVEDPSEDADNKASTPKRSVIRRKVGEPKVSINEEVKEPESTVDGSSTETLSEEVMMETRVSETSGLRIVSQPVKPIIAVEPEVIKESAPVEKADEIFKEKVHRFTPVYTPPPVEKPAAKSTTGETGTTAGATAEDDDKSKLESKKRLGGLASMMSGKTRNVNKSLQLQQSRADAELKTYSSALSGLGRPLYSPIKKKKMFSGMGSQTELTEVKDKKRIIHVHKGCSAEELAKKLSVKFQDLANQVLDVNLLIKSDDYIGLTLAQEIGAIYGYRVDNKAFNEDEVLGKTEKIDTSGFPLRDPIITIMGHVDHGKTTLLDYIRNAKVADGEAGGITQHIGAYSVKTKKKNLTFLDTPGHAAFADMRQRGASITDIVILVVAADDGAMPQTKESIKFCQNAGVPIIVAINKMDKEGVNPEKVKSELAEFNLNPEEWGGETMYCPISALKGEGIDELLENVALQAEMLELRADPKGYASGVVIESKIEIGRGPVATILIEKGTLKKGDTIVVGESFGRARSLTNHLGELLTNAGPSIPVQILGLDQAPSPGDELSVVKNEREAKKVAANRVNERRELESGANKKAVVSLEDFFGSEATEEAKTLNLIVRSDVQGSFEAIKQSVEALGNKEVKVNVIAGGVGAISDNDVTLAASSQGYILGFNMRPVTSARKLAEKYGVDVKTYSIIYELIDDIKAAIEGLLVPEFNEKFIGRAEVREIFNVPKLGTIAGTMVIDGKIQVGCNIRLLRNGKIMHDGKLSSLRRFKDDVKEVKNGLECGMALQDFIDIKVGDLFEAYILEEKKRTLEDVAEEERREEAEKVANAAQEAADAAANLEDQPSA